MINLNGKTAIVTGGTSGLGLGIAIVLARTGASVILAGRDKKKLENAELHLRQSGYDPAFALSFDVTDGEAIKNMVEEVLGREKKIDILVNNAGVIAASGWEHRTEQNDADWAINYEVNLRGVARIIDEVLPHMKKRAYGKIINITSGAGRQGVGSHLPIAYGAVKAGVINMTQNYALALAPFNINVNAVCPGLIWTPMWEKVGAHLSISRESEKGLTPREVFDRQIKTRVPLKRPQTPEDVGHAVAFLVSDEAQNITGQTLNVNGGLRMD